MVSFGIAVLFAAGVGALILNFMPNAFGSPFSGLRQRRGDPVERLAAMLGRAGLYNEAPMFTLAALLVASGLVGAGLAVVLGSLLGFLLGPVAVLVPGWMYVRRMQARFLDRAQTEVVPFLSRIEASVRANEPSSVAYRAALADPSCRLLSSLLSESAHRMESGTPFIQALRETTAKLPLNMWLDFVSQMELHASTGGAIGDAITEAIGGINEQITLQAEAKAAYARQATQQKAILGLIGLGLVIFTTRFSTNAASLMLATPIGLGITIVSLSTIAFSIWMGRKAIDDIKEWIGF